MQNEKGIVLCKFRSKRARGVYEMQIEPVKYLTLHCQESDTACGGLRHPQAGALSHLLSAGAPGGLSAAKIMLRAS